MRQVYRCDYCGHVELTEKQGQEHENNCDWNPINKKCMSCKEQKNDRRLCCKHGLNHVDEFGEKGLCEDWK